MFNLVSNSILLTLILDAFDFNEGMHCPRRRKCLDCFANLFISMKIINLKISSIFTELLFNNL